MALFGALVASLAIGVAGASALQTHLLLGSFNPADGFSSFGPQGIAVDADSGEVYVSDFNRSAVFVFATDGTPAATPELTEADGVTPAALFRPKGVAVDNSAGPTKGYVYVANTGASTVRQFDATGAASGQAPITAASVPAAGTPQSGGLPNVVNDGSLLLHGVAVDSAGKVYVVDAANEVIDVFTSGGDFVSQLGAGIVAGPRWVAVDPAGNVYITGDTALTKLSPSGECLNSCEPIDHAGLSGVATDAAGHVYVSELHEIAEFDADGERVSTLAIPTVRPHFSGAGYVSGVAVNPVSGDVYLTDLIMGNLAAARFGPRVTIPSATTGVAEDVAVNSATLEGNVEPGGAAVTECEFEYGTTPEYGQSVPCAESPASLGSGPGDVPVHADVTGLTAGSPYYFRLTAGNTNGAAAFPGAEFSTLPALYLTPEAPTDDDGRSIKLNALLNDRGLTPTACAFEYVTEVGFEINGGDFSSLDSGGSVPCEPAAASIPADGDDHPISAQLTDLVGNSTYHYRITAANSDGVATVEGLEFTTAQTPPIVTTGQVSDIDLTHARFHGLVNPAGLQTTYYFEYGTSSAYGSKLPVAEGDAGSGRFALEVSRAVADLRPSTTYHFRLVGTNAAGTEAGADVAFTTRAPFAEPALMPPVASAPAAPTGRKPAPRRRCHKRRHQRAHKPGARSKTKARCTKRRGQSKGKRAPGTRGS